MKQSILIIALLAQLSDIACTTAFTPHALIVTQVSRSTNGRFPLFMADVTTFQDENVLSDDETSLINALWNQSNQNNDALQEILLQTLPTMSSRLTMKLKQTNQKRLSTDIRGSSGSADEAIVQVAEALQSVLDDKLSTGRDVLATLLSAGELRKLDAEIGKASRAGKLDMAFFTVLDMNIKDAIMDETTEANDNDDAVGTTTTSTTTGSDPGQTASRLSILKHVYTRCQEEVEKLVPPGVALLNKLLRTDQDSIRANQLQHYLCPQPNVIVLPDGQVIPVRDAERNKVLVPPADLVQALAMSVTQIRTVETAGGMSREVAANMVEACRNVAKEARLVIGKEYGVESQELQEFEEGLQPVFRPASPDSEFIQGVR
jgi:hypothetical protein